ncbi:hypothetical protein Poli38472_002340 [Pythium oligandrum]|uniref:EF-hand domain-containing protein n=1 Tax=Pythium oligandrum TaxID=41045 RepID=A0A8K1CH10_PYTOL|nr:hypothetical protein Poli38472_002340 [Pythium oligandrum]|eukprot:TMW63399.1 hypothetical protein Poli38472_002340 [Pythium oligandrum]
MSAVAVEGRLTVTNFLKGWVEAKLLTYKFSVQENPQHPQRVHVTFSKPTIEEPAPAAVAHCYFHLDNQLQSVVGFTVESEKHLHSVTDLRFDEKILDHVIRRKLHLKQQRLLDLSDEFSSTRVPSIVKDRADEKREMDREAMEEYLLERFQRKDPYNDGRVSFQDFKDVLYALELPRVTRRDREIILAFVDLDRDDMVDYGALIGIAVDVIDTLMHSRRLGEHDDKDSKHKPSKSESSIAAHDVIEWYHAVHKSRQFYTIDKLEQLLEAFRRVPTPPPSEETGTTDTPDVSKTDDSGDQDGGAIEEAPTVNIKPPDLFVTRRQLRTCLESPQLMLSKPEVNLILSLVEVNATTELIGCAQLGSLYQHVEEMVFRFQYQCFSDRIERFLLQQFTNYESSTLQGASEHLKKRLRQREIRAVIKDMRKLMLNPYQMSHVMVLCEDNPVSADSVMHYEKCVPRIAKYLKEEVDLGALEEKTLAIHTLHQDEEHSQVSLPSEEEVRQIATEVFEAADEGRLGVLSTADFQSSLESLVKALSIRLEDDSGLHALCALADPLGQGRVNYVFFQQLAYPSLRVLLHNKRVARWTETRRTAARNHAEAKAATTEHENSKEE